MILESSAGRISIDGVESWGWWDWEPRLVGLVVGAGGTESWVWWG